MQVVLFTDRAGKALAPFTQRTCAALLPVVGKPIVVHTLESIARISPEKVFVVVSPHADAVESELGDGRRWGLDLEYVLTRGDETPDTVLDRLRPRLSGDFLVLRGDVLLSPCLAAFLDRAAALPGPTVAATISGAPTGVRLVRGDAAGPLNLPYEPESLETWKEDAPTVELADEAHFCRVESLAAFHRANLDAAAGGFDGLIVPGREVKPGVVVGRQSRLTLDSVQAGPVFVGSRCDVKAGAEIRGGVVLADDVVVDRNATLSSAVILPHTYVGEMVDVSDAIVWSNDLVHVDSGAVAHVTDDFLLADLGSGGLEEGAANIVHRSIGFLLWLVSLPLWPIVLLASLLADLKTPLRTIELIGNRTTPGPDGERVRSTFKAWEAATRIPILRHLPLLLAVIRGDIRLVGVTPLTPEEASHRTEDWERLRDLAPAGLIGPAQLSLSTDAPEEERWVLEAYYAQTRTAISDFVWLARGVGAFFTPRAWGPGLRPRTS